MSAAPHASNACREPAITVIMAVYNAAPYLKECVDSIVNQTFGDFEFLVVDDCSTDGSCEIVAAYRDPRIRIIRCAVNAGQSAAQNRALDQARGRYIALMDADDVCALERFETQLQFLESNPDIDACGAQVRYFGERNDMVNNLPLDADEIRAGLCFSCCFSTQGGLYRRNFFESPKIRYTEGLVNGQDYELIIRGAKNHRLAAVPQCLHYYRIHPTQVTKTAHDAAVITAQHNLQYLQSMLEVPFTDAQQRMFTQIRTEDKHNGDLCHLKESAAFLSHLLELNRQKHCFVPELFARKLGLFWFRYLKPCTRHGLRCWRELQNSGLRTILPRSKQFKFFLRCLTGQWLSFK